MVDLSILRQQLEKHYSEEDLRNLCFDLGVDHENLQGETKPALVRELCAYLERHSRIPELMEMVKKTRPDVPWEDTSEKSLDQTEDHFLEFANREQEMSLLKDFLIKRSPPSHILIDAPAGYGKSFMLRRLLDPMKLAGWCWYLLDVRSGGHMLPEELIRCLIQQLAGSSSQSIERISSREKLEDKLLSMLSVLFRSCKGGVLVIDSVDDLTESKSAEWLRKFLKEIPRKIRDDCKQFSVVISGRQAKRFWKRELPYIILLSPFTVSEVDRLLKGVCERTGIVRPSKTLRSLATCIYHFSGGHPDAIQSLIAKVHTSGFPMGAKELIDKQHRLYEQYLKPLIDRTLESTQQETRELLSMLSPLRMWNWSSIKTLVDEGFLENMSPDDYVSILTRTDFVLSPEKQYNPPFYRDGIMRHLLAFEREVVARQNFIALNMLAVDFYDECLHERRATPSRPFSDLFRIFLPEILFHRLCLSRLKVSKSEMAQVTNRYTPRTYDPYTRFDLSAVLGPYFRIWRKGKPTDKETNQTRDTLIKKLEADEDVSWMLSTILGENWAVHLKETIAQGLAKGIKYGTTNKLRRA